MPRRSAIAAAQALLRRNKGKAWPPTSTSRPSGNLITEGTLAQWLKKPGEAVKADEPIASLETDKVSVEVPSPIAGVLTEQLVEEGDTVAVGAAIARIDEGATAGAAPPAHAVATAEAATNPAGAGETPALKGEFSPLATRRTTRSRPCHRRFAARFSNITSIRLRSAAPARTDA